MIRLTILLVAVMAVVASAYKDAPGYQPGAASVDLALISQKPRSEPAAQLRKVRLLRVTKVNSEPSDVTGFSLPARRTTPDTPALPTPAAASGVIITRLAVQYVNPSFPPLLQVSSRDAPADAAVHRPASAAAVAGPGAQVIGNRVNLREGASTNFRIVTRLSRGTAVVVLSEDNGWVQLQVAGINTTGYISARFVRPAE